MLPLFRFAKAEIINKVFGAAFLYVHDFGPTLIVGRNLHSTRGHYFFGVHSFEEELFAIHFLRKDELFIDVGANLGMFSIMVAATTGARALAFEPSPSSAEVFKRHIALNDLSDRIILLEKCVGDATGTALIKNTVEMDNFVVLEGTKAMPEMASVPMVRIDDVVDGKVPCLMKMDIEGFELQALNGATQLLKNRNLRAMTIEIAELSRRFGVSGHEIRDFISGFGFLSIEYEPFGRRVSPTSLPKFSAAHKMITSDTIYVRDLEETRYRLTCSPARTLAGFTV